MCEKNFSLKLSTPSSFPPPLLQTVHFRGQIRFSNRNVLRQRILFKLIGSNVVHNFTRSPGLSSSDLRERIFFMLYSQEKTEEAILQLNRVIKQMPKNSQAFALKAYALNRLANTRQEWMYSKHALEYADRALVLNPNDDIALTSKGWALIDLDKAEEALMPLKQATK